jgi:hypothetical protein
MRRYPTLTWEYVPKTRAILAARELAAGNNPEEVTTDAEEHARSRGAEATAPSANQAEEAE